MSKTIAGAVLAIAAALMLALPAPSALAGAIAVTTTSDHAPDGCTIDDCTLREAILQANEQAGSETIELGAGTYVIEIPGAAENAGLTGDFDLLDSVTIEGAGPGQTIIDAQQLERVFDIPDLEFEDYSVSLSDMTVTNGATQGGGNGGGIRAEANLEMTRVHVTANVANGDFGGGLVAGFNVVADLRSVVFSGNSSNLGGGGISTFAGANLIVEGGEFSNNESGNGGGIRAVGNATLVDITVRDNTASFGAGGLDLGSGLASDITLSSSIVEGNTAVNRAGGISATGDVEITRTAIVNNHAGVRGGGVYNTVMLEATNVTISGNSTDGDGGGVYNGEVFGGRVELKYSTIANNAADDDDNGAGDGGGLFNAEIAGSPALTGFELHNSIVAYNTDPTSDPDCWGEFDLSDGNIISQGSDNCTFDGLSAGDLIGVDPLLGPLTNNGGDTLTHALREGSPAIDAGTDCPPPSTDQRLEVRPEGPDCDMGAFEGVASLIWGDTRCDGLVEPGDALPILFFVAGIGSTSAQSNGACPGIDETVDTGEATVQWGNVACQNGDVGTLDALAILQWYADFEYERSNSCPELGTPVDLETS